MTDGEAIQPSPVLVKTEDDLVGSVRWESEGEVSVRHPAELAGCLAPLDEIQPQVSASKVRIVQLRVAHREVGAHIGSL